MTQSTVIALLTSSRYGREDVADVKSWKHHGNYYYSAVDVDIGEFYDRHDCQCWIYIDQYRWRVATPYSSGNGVYGFQWF